MPFGLTNVHAYFVDLTSRAFKGHLNKFVVVSTDDILVFIKGEDVHENHLRKVIETLRRHRLKAKFSKCLFEE